MKQISINNFVGGFLGGISGILTFHYLGFWMMLFSTLVLSVLGWHYLSICKIAKTFALQAFKIASDLNHESAVKRKSMIRTVCRHAKSFQSGLTSLIIFLTFRNSPNSKLGLWLQWQLRLRRSQGKFLLALISTINSLCFGIGIFALTFYLFPANFFVDGTINPIFGLDDQKLAEALFVSIMIWMLSVGFTIAFGSIFFEQKKKILPFHVERKLLFCLHWTLWEIKVMALVFWYLSMAMIRCVGVFLPLFAFTFLPLMILLPLLRAIIKIFYSTTGHWNCLIVTLLTTAISALSFEDYFVDMRLLLLVSLTTGFAAGSLSLGIGIAINWLNSQDRVIPLWEKFNQEGLLERLFEALLKWAWRQSRFVPVGHFFD